jgi:hypothetical protein
MPPPISPSLPARDLLYDAEPMALRFKSCARTDVGIKRTNNEDSHFVDDARAVLVLDGD